MASENEWAQVRNTRKQRKNNTDLWKAIGENTLRAWVNSRDTCNLVNNIWVAIENIEQEVGMVDGEEVWTNGWS